jgi:hypothetical protein
MSTVRSSEETHMHPLLMAQFAEAQSVALHEDAAKRRRFSRARSRRAFSVRLPRRAARVAHV